MRPFKYLMIFTTFLLLYRCNKDAELKPKDYPFVITNPPKVGEVEIEFSADLSYLGKQKILNYGFVWSNKSKPTIRDNSKLFSDEPKKGVYSHTVKSGLIKGQTYYVRACILTDIYEVYGTEESFISLGSRPPVINNFTPKYGPVGTPIIIDGENFVLSKNGNIVKFGNTEAVVDSISENRLWVTVPKVTEPEKVTISVETADMITVSEEEFDVWFPWIRKSDYPGTYFRSSNNFIINDKIYICEGWVTEDSLIMKEFWEYNPLTDIWTRKPDFPGEARHYAIGFSCNGRGYYGLGTTYSLDNEDYAIDLWEYNPENEQWIRMADFPGTPVILSKSFVVKNKAYISPGYFWKDTWDTFVDDLWEFDPVNNVWQQKKDFPGGERFCGLAIGTNDFGYLGLGSNGWGIRDFYKYDPNSDTWELVGNYPGKGYNDVAGFFINEKLYLGMGSNNSNVSYSDFWEYDLINNKWKEMNSCPTKLSPSFSLTSNNKGYLGYGWYDLTINDKTYGRVIYEFDPSKN